MSKLIKTFLVFCICSSYGFNAFSQYNQNTNVFKRKKSPTSSSTNNSTKTTPSQDIYKNAGVRAAIYEEDEAMEIIKNDKQNNPGHSLNKSAQPNYNPKNKVGTTSNQQTNRRSLNQPVQRKSSNNHPYQVKRAKGTQSTSKTNQNGAFQNAKTLNFDVLNESGRKTTNSNRNYTPSQRRSTSYYSGHYNNSVKIYNQRGERVSANYSNVNRSVIIVPKQGLTVTGIVTSDDPGRSITIKDNLQKSLTYQYTDMDALVNI